MAETIISKKCPKCKQIKPVSEFYKDKAKKDGHQGACKSCQLEYFRQYRRTEKGKTYHKRYRQSEKGKEMCRKSRKRHQFNHPLLHKTKAIVAYAVKTGKLPRASTLKCTYCSKQAKERHHPDYTKPFEVKPVCVECHNHIHNPITT